MLRLELLHSVADTAYFYSGTATADYYYQTHHCNSKSKVNNSRTEQILCSHSNPHHKSNKEEDGRNSSRRKWKRIFNGAQRTNTGPNQGRGGPRDREGGRTRTKRTSRMTRQSWLLKSTKRYRRTTNDRESARAGKAGGLGTRGPEAEVRGWGDPLSSSSQRVEMGSAAPGRSGREFDSGGQPGVRARERAMFSV